MDQPKVLLSTVDDDIAAENGRRVAMHAMANNPDQRKRVEETFGISYCKLRYPELYAPAGFFKRIFDRLTFKKS